MSAILALFGLQDGLKLGRGVILALVCGGLFAAGGLGFWRGMAAIERMNAEAASAARRTAEAEHRAAIEASNTRIIEANLRAATAAAEISARAEAEMAGLRATLTELERRNAELPNGAAGVLDRDRVRLLREPAGGP
jgi:hypothetical protein